LICFLGLSGAVLEDGAFFVCGFSVVALGRISFAFAAIMAERPATSRWTTGTEWVLNDLLAINFLWTTLCLGGYRPETMVVTSALAGVLFLVHLFRRASVADDVAGLHPAGWWLLPVLEMYVQGVSTRWMKTITEELCGHEFSASAVSTMNVKVAQEAGERTRPSCGRAHGNCFRKIWCGAGGGQL
jgi:hypothetical protein